VVLTGLPELVRLAVLVEHMVLAAVEILVVLAGLVRLVVLGLFGPALGLTQTIRMTFNLDR
jgi:hypothetical protein